MQVHESLRRCRKYCGATQKQAAAAAGISETMYQYYEYGRSEPTAHILISLADYFNVSLDYLVGRTDIPEVNR